MADQDVLTTAVRLGTSVDALAALAAHLRLETEQLPADPAVRELLGDHRRRTGRRRRARSRDGSADDRARTHVSAAGERIGREPGPQRRVGHGRRPTAAKRRQAVDGDQRGRAGRRTVGCPICAIGWAPPMPGCWTSAPAPAGWPSPSRNRTRRCIWSASTSSSRPWISPGPTSRVPALPTGSNSACRTPRCWTSADGYDAIWLAMPFLPKAVVVPIVNAAARSLKPGGWLLPGTFTGPGDRLSELLTDLRTVRSGGHPWRPEEIIDLMAHGRADRRPGDRARLAGAGAAVRRSAALIAQPVRRKGRKPRAPPDRPDQARRACVHPATISGGRAGRGRRQLPERSACRFSLCTYS